MYFIGLLKPDVVHGISAHVVNGHMISHENREVSERKSSMQHHKTRVYKIGSAELAAQPILLWGDYQQLTFRNAVLYCKAEVQEKCCLITHVVTEQHFFSVNYCLTEIQLRKWICGSHLCYSLTPTFLAKLLDPNHEACLFPEDDESPREFWVVLFENDFLTFFVLVMIQVCESFIPSHRHRGRCHVLTSWLFLNMHTAIWYSKVCGINGYRA